MCLILFAHRVHPEFPLLLAANRDEFLDRPTSPMQWRTDVACGQDERSGGTWIGVQRSGRWAAVTNFRGKRESQLTPESPRSRGELVWDFLNGSESPADYMERVRKQSSKYPGFNLLVSDLEEVFYFGNRLQHPTPMKPLEPGIFGLSNGVLDTPWPKVQLGKQRLGLICESKPSIDLETLFLLLKDATRPDDEHLPDTGIGLEKERLLSSMFIQSEGYGTRCSTALSVSKKNEIKLTERTFPEAIDRSFNWTASR